MREWKTPGRTSSRHTRKAAPNCPGVDGPLPPFSACVSVFTKASSCVMTCGAREGAKTRVEEGGGMA